MLQLTHLSGFGAGGAASTPQFLYDQIVARSLTSSLQLCLDAGDSRCYDGSSQTWSDCSGNSHDFERGTTGSAEAADPSWTGSIGSWGDSTYFSFDGGDYFTPTSFHTFAQNWHKNNGAFSIAAIVYAPTISSITRIFATSNEAASDAGMAFRITSSAQLALMRSITTTTREISTTSGTVTQNSWNFVGCSYDEATTALVLRINGTSESFTPTASTDTDAHPDPMAIGNRPDLTVPAQSGFRMAALGAWSTPIGSTALANLYTDAKTRIPSIP